AAATASPAAGAETAADLAPDASTELTPGAPKAAKVCGAGGGGCIAFLCADGRKEEVERALSEEEEVQMLRWDFAPEGLTVRES
ncbi:MAG: GHMP kinase, partial [Acidobacteria bacterium]|nr:GHMP kinase [Acidobacteriota bacterium]